MAGQILNNEDQAKMMAWYDARMKAARSALPPPPPGLDPSSVNDPKKLADYKAVLAAHKEKLAVYKNNPMRKVVLEAEATAAEMGLVPGSTGYQLQVEEEIKAKRAGFEAGLKEGAKDQSHIQKAFGHLQRFEIFAAIKEFFLSIPIIGDFMATGGKMIMSLFSGNPKGPISAFNEIRKERALGGAFEKLGYTDVNQVKALTASTIAEAENPPAVPTGSAGTEPAKPDTPAAGVLKSGVMVPAMVTKDGAAVPAPELNDIIAADKANVLLEAIKKTPGVSIVKVDDSSGTKPIYYIGKVNDAGVMTVESVVLTTDKGLKKIQSGLVTIGKDKKLAEADVAAIVKDLSLPRLESGNILPAMSTISKGDATNLVAPALKEIDAKGNITAAMDKVTAGVPQVILVPVDIGADKPPLIAAYVGYVKEEGSKRQLKIEQMLIRDPATNEFKAVDTALPDKMILLEGTNVSSDKAVRDALVKDGTAKRGEDGKVITTDAETASLKEAMSKLFESSAKSYIGMKDADVPGFVKAKMDSITSSKSVAELQKAKTTLSENLDAGIGLRTQFIESKKLDMGIPDDKDPFKDPALSDKANEIQKAWETFLKENPKPKSDKDKPVNLEALDKADTKSIRELSDALRLENGKKRGARDLKKLAADAPDRVMDGSKTSELSPSVQAVILSMPDAKKELEGKKFIVVTEGDKTAVYIGTEVAGEGGKKTFQTNRGMQLQGTTWKDIAAKPADMPALKLDETGTKLDADSLKAIQKFTGKLPAGASPDITLPTVEKPVKITENQGFVDTLAAFVDAVNKVQERFPPTAQPTVQADKQVVRVEMPTVPDLVSTGRKI